MRAKKGHGRHARAAILLAAAIGTAVAQRELLAATAVKATYTYNRGSYDETGFYNSTFYGEFVAGQRTTSSTLHTYRDFFVFDTDQLTTPVTASYMYLYQPSGGFVSPSGSE